MSSANSPFSSNNTRSKLTCSSEPCVLTDRAKDREKRFVACSSPGCQKHFHAACVGLAKKSEKELNNLFFVCLKCEAYLNYSAEIARKSVMSELDDKLHNLKSSILQSVDEKIKNESTLIKQQAQALCDSVIKQFDEKISELRSHTNDANEFVLSALRNKESKVSTLQSGFQSLNEKYLTEVNALRSQCKAVEDQLASFDLKRRKESFIVRNFPENLSNECSNTAKAASTCRGAISSIANALGLSDEANNIHEAFRLGKPRQDGKPRLIMVKAPERTCRLFLTKARFLRQAQAPLCNVFLQEDLPPEVNKKLIEMRRKAYEHRTKNPGEEAYVKNKKLYINGFVVEEITQNF